MQYRSPSLSPVVRKGLIGMAIIGGSVTAHVRTAPAAPKVEAWPGQRVLLVLPVTTASDWKGDAALARAIPSIAQPQLQSALDRTGKFSLTLPYRFDPVLRRAVEDKRIPDAEVRALVATPNLATSRPIMDKLVFDQTSFIADVQVLEVRAGGTPKSPTLQVQAAGRLYEQGKGAPIRSIVATSPSVTGKTPEERISRASLLAFQEIAAEFVKPAALLPLPVPAAPSPAPKPVAPAPKPPAGNPIGQAPVLAPPPADVKVSPPNSLSTGLGEAFVPQLPVGRPPLGLSVPGDQGVAR